MKKVFDTVAEAQKEFLKELTKKLEKLFEITPKKDYIGIMSFLCHKPDKNDCGDSTIYLTVSLLIKTDKAQRALDRYLVEDAWNDRYFVVNLRPDNTIQYKLEMEYVLGLDSFIV